MLIHNDGIYREIDEKDLQKYKDKGYKVVEEAATDKPENSADPEKPKK